MSGGKQSSLCHIFIRIEDMRENASKENRTNGSHFTEKWIASHHSRTEPIIKFLLP